MFKQKKESLNSVVKTKASVKENNAFLTTAFKKSAETKSGNGALKYSTTGNAFVDQFGKLGNYKSKRTFDEISRDMSELYSIDKEMAVKFTIYMRIITRTIAYMNGQKTKTVQRGAGLKHESMVRMIWLYLNDKNAFYNNIGLFISAGSWNDVIQMLSYDIQYNGWDDKVLDWDFMGKAILSGLENPNTTNLVRKYLPQIKANSKCKSIESQSDNIISKWICSLIFGQKTEGDYKTYKMYRELKNKGCAHQWQQLISQGKHKLVNFDTVHGRALSNMISGNYLKNNGLVEKYEKWIESRPIAKYTGYVHELFKKLPNTQYQIDTLNAQFKGLVETGKKNVKTGTSLIVVRDTSSSMGSIAKGTGMSCYNIGKALALYFSEMLSEGYFANSWIEFNSKAEMHKWTGKTPYEKWSNDLSSYYGSTNFQSIIDLFSQIKKYGIDESEFPTGILCISDSEFDPSSLHETNVERALYKLRSSGFSENYVNNFKIVLWNLQSSYYGCGTGEKFETYGDVKNVYYFSGYDGSTIAFLTGVEGQKSEPKTAEELFFAAMDQEILKAVTV